MNWAQIWTEIILSVVGLIISTVGVYITAWISGKIKNDKVKRIVKDALDIVSDGVDYTYQTYVEGLKGTSMWDEEAKKAAKEKALYYIQTNLKEKTANYLSSNCEDVTEWIINQIEIAIKNKKDNYK